VTETVTSTIMMSPTPLSGTTLEVPAVIVDQDSDSESDSDSDEESEEGEKAEEDSKTAPTVSSVPV
jgi:hypothetical protein